MPRITVVLNDNQKERWDSFAEESREYDSTADLVRKSVEGVIPEDGEESESGDNEGAVSDDVLAAVEDVESAVHQIETEVKALRTETVQEADMEELVAEVVHIHGKDAVNEALKNYDFSEEFERERGGYKR